MRRHKKSIRFSDAEQRIIDKVREGFNLPTDGAAVRFVLNFWWKSLGSDAVDVKKLGKLLREDQSNRRSEDGHT